MNKEDIVAISNALDSIHKDMCNIYNDYPNNAKVKKVTIDIAYLKEYIDKKIEAPSDKTNASI